MQHVNQFVKNLLASKEMQQFDKARVFLDEDFTAVDKFTALGSLYFIHQSIQNAQIYDWIDCKFVPVIGREVLSGNIETVSIKEKSKFPLEYYPDSKWSRKGFIRTRWNICNTVFDHINIHLFHDASNIIAMESNPSIYCDNRRRAMEYTIERFENDTFDKVPYLVFGDFNFRLDTHNLIKKLSEKLEAQHIRGKKNDISKILYTSPHSSQPVLTIEKKGFNYHEHHSDFSNNNNRWLHEYDREPNNFCDRLYEYEVTFAPSYPFSEDVEDGTSYMKTRCPSWCDRIFLDKSTYDIIYHDENDTQPEYNIIGPNVCMGDHKPVYLNFRLRQGAGNLSASPDPAVAAENAVTSPQHSPMSTGASSSDGSESEKPPLKKVISINGEEVDVSDMDHVNIHDYATFEQEEIITTKFFSTIRRHTNDGTESESDTPESPVKLKRQLSFHTIAREVVQKENVLLALKHYSHRSDSESEIDEDEANKSKSSIGSVFLPEESSVLPQGISQSNHDRISASSAYKRTLSHPDLDKELNPNRLKPFSTPYSESEPRVNTLPFTSYINDNDNQSDLTSEKQPLSVNGVKVEMTSSTKTKYSLKPVYDPEWPDKDGKTQPKGFAFCPCPCVVL